MESASWQGFSVYSDETGFVGWHLRDPQPATLTTANNVGLGMTRVDLESSGFAAIDVEQTTIGTEWSAGSLAGLLSSDADDGLIDAMWAGQTCIAR